MPARVSLCALVLLVAGLATPPPAHSQKGYPEALMHGTITVEGNVSLLEADPEDPDNEEVRLRWVSLVASSPKMAPQPQDPCHFDLDLRTGSGSAEFSLSAILTGGLPFIQHDSDPPFDSPPVKVFYVGRAEFGRPWQENARRGVFYASLDLGPSEERTIDVRTIPGSGTFRSRGSGYVALRHFDGSAIWLVFRVPMIENIGDKYGPRRLMVDGQVSIKFGQSPFGDVYQLWGVAPEIGGAGAAATIYRCGNLDEVKQAAADAGISMK